jgi:ribosomal protein L25 (general stress protein Ctc)
MARSRDASNLHDLDLIEVRRNGVVIAEFYVEPEEQIRIPAELKKFERALSEPTENNVSHLRVVRTEEF